MALPIVAWISRYEYDRMAYKGLPQRRNASHQARLPMCVCVCVRARVAAYLYSQVWKP